jgi:hypothetical protein
MARNLEALPHRGKGAAENGRPQPADTMKQDAFQGEGGSS